MLFTAAAVAGALIISFEVAPARLIDSATFHLARAAAYNLMNVYAIKMAGVFMITSSTIAIYTGFAPRWLARVLLMSVYIFLSEIKTVRTKENAAL